MLNIINAVFGGVMLFLGRSMDWLFSLGMGLLVGLKISESLLSPATPLWMQLLVIGAVGAIGVLPHLVYPDSSYIVTGILFGGFAMSEYANTVMTVFFGKGLVGSTWLIFFVGAIFGGVVLGFIREWGIMLATALVGGFMVAALFTRLDAFTQLLVASGLFIVGGIVQVLFKFYEDKSEP